VTEGAVSIHDATGSINWILGADMFIPISLGNHYYSSETLRRVMVEFISKSRISVIFLCDRLRFLSYLIRGETNISQINANIQIQLDQITRTLNKVGLGSYSNGTVADWSFLEEDARYAALVSSLADFARKDSAVHQTLSQHATQLLSRFRGKSLPEESMPLQIQYILEETSLSLYMTEVRGFNVEVYRRGMGFVDYLYSHRSDDVKKLMRASKLNRRFVAIEDWLPSKERRTTSSHP
jgi:tRNA-dependent cyclodipeptide synthase